MKRHHQHTLEALFAHPLQHSIRVSKVEALLRVLGAEVEERADHRLHIRMPGGQETWLHSGGPRHPDLDGEAVVRLRQFLKDGRTFDAIVLDPPKFAPSAAHADRAARAYKDINRLAFKLLEPGGVLFTYSCSGGIGAELFHKIVASAGTDAGVDGYISERMQGAPDHPMTLVFPEGEYLKGLVVMKTAALGTNPKAATIEDRREP